MSAVSRVEKMICESGAAASLAEAASRLERGLTITIGPEAQLSAHLLAPAVVGLALRCFRGYIDLVIAPSLAGSVDWRACSLRDLCMAEGVAYGEPRRIRFDMPHDPTALRLGIGDRSVPLHVNASGWRALISTPHGPTGVAAAPAAAFAAAVGVAKLFGAEVLGRAIATTEIVDFDLWGFSDDVDAATPSIEVELGRVALLGAGAIGSALAWILRASGWRARVMVIDDDEYDTPNEETSMMIGRADARDRKPKAARLAALLQSSRIDAEWDDTRVNATSAVLGQQCDMFVCAVDNAKTRRELDGTNARVILNAAVGGDRETAGIVLWTRHGPSDRSLSATYPMRADEVPDVSRAPLEVAGDLCSRVAYGEVSLAAPFGALVAGALLASSAARAAAGTQTVANEIEFDLFHAVSKYTSLARK